MLLDLSSPDPRIESFCFSLQSSQGHCRTCIRPLGTRSIRPLLLGRTERADTRQLQRLHPALCRKLEQMFGQAGPHPISSAVRSGRISLCRKRRWEASLWKSRYPASSPSGIWDLLGVRPSDRMASKHRSLQIRGWQWLLTVYQTRKTCLWRPGWFGTSSDMYDGSWVFLYPALV
jgi:hypothetical protein